MPSMCSWFILPLSTKMRILRKIYIQMMNSLREFTHETHLGIAES